MKNIFCTFLLFVFLYSCTDNEELTPSGAIENLFAVSDDASDAESILRREFFENENSYLLFNDTLYKEFLGRDRYGNEVYFIEVIDLAYNFLNTNNIQYLFQYIKTLEEKEAAKEFVATEIFSHIQKSVRPYSILLVNNIDEWYRLSNVAEFTLQRSNLPVYLGTRCMAISSKDFLNMSLEEKKMLKDTVCITYMLGIKPGDYDEVLNDFYSYSSEYFGKYVDDYPEISDPRTLGFLNTTLHWSGVYIFPLKPEDLVNYIKLIYHKTISEIETEYEEYPIVINRCVELIKVFSDLGFIFKD